MGTCCENCLPAKVRANALNAENGAVTVAPLLNPEGEICGHIIGRIAGEDEDIQCTNQAFFEVSYYPKKK